MRRPDLGRFRAPESPATAALIRHALIRTLAQVRIDTFRGVSCRLAQKTECASVSRSIKSTHMPGPPLLGGRAWTNHPVGSRAHSPPAGRDNGGGRSVAQASEFAANPGRRFEFHQRTAILRWRSRIWRRPAKDRGGACESVPPGTALVLSRTLSRVSRTAEHLAADA